MMKETEDDYYMKKPCQHCPFRRDVTPFLHPDRAYEIASIASNPYSTFTCHKTLEDNEDYDEDYGSILIAGEASKECAGFLTMRAGVTDRGIPDGFEPDWQGCYDDIFDMEFAYQEEWEKQRG